MAPAAANAASSAQNYASRPSASRRSVSVNKPTYSSPELRRFRTKMSHFPKLCRHNSGLARILQRGKSAYDVAHLRAMTRRSCIPSFAGLCPGAFVVVCTPRGLQPPGIRVWCPVLARPMTALPLGAYTPIRGPDSPRQRLQAPDTTTDAVQHFPAQPVH